MNVMETYTQSLDDAALIDLAKKNLVESQKRVVLAEVERRGLEVA